MILSPENPSQGRSPVWRQRAASARSLSGVALLLIATQLLGCSAGSVGDGAARDEAAGNGAAGDSRTPLRVVATTGPVGDMVRRVAGEHAEVDVMMGPGVDPHLYKELPSDIRKVAAADVVFYNGLHLEGRMTDTLERRGERHAVVAVTQSLADAKDPRLRYPADFEGFADPHVWHDAALWADCVPIVAETLAAADPAHADAFATAADEYRNELLALDRECREMIAELPESVRVLVTAHDAFGYFSVAYGLDSVGLKGTSTEDEVAIGRMDEVVQLVIDRGVPAVFVESSVAPRIVEAVIEPCQAAGHEVRIGGELYADSLGPPDSGADTHAGMMRANVQTIVSGLRGETSAE